GCDRIRLAALVLTGLLALDRRADDPSADVAKGFGRQRAGLRLGQGRAFENVLSPQDLCSEALPRDVAGPDPVAGEPSGDEQARRAPERTDVRKPRDRVIDRSAPTGRRTDIVELGVRPVKVLEHLRHPWARALVSVAQPSAERQRATATRGG